jgi:hypothetical protein
MTENKSEQAFQSCGEHHAQTLYQYQNQACSVGNPLTGKAIRPRAENNPTNQSRRRENHEEPRRTTKKREAEDLGERGELSLSPIVTP